MKRAINHIDCRFDYSILTWVDELKTDCLIDEFSQSKEILCWVDWLVGRLGGR